MKDNIMRIIIAAFAIVLAVILLSGCSTLNRYGIGGEPMLYCRMGVAVIDDKLVGPESARLSVVRRFSDGDALCVSPASPPALPRSVAAQTPRGVAARPPP